MKTIRRPQKPKQKNFTGKIIVEHDNFEKAFRQFKRRSKKAGIVQECKNRSYHMTKGEKERARKKAAIRRHK